MSAALLPGSIITVSSCLAGFVPDTWAIAWTGDTAEQRREDAGFFGIDEAALDKVVQWVTERFDTDIGWPNVCLRLDVAAELLQRFLAGQGDVVVLELGLHRDYVETFCAAAEPPEPGPGQAPMGRHGVLQALMAGNQVGQEGRVLGFEPIAFNHGLSCSWLCNGLETVVFEKLGIRPGEEGLIREFADARSAVELFDRPEVGAEPGLWLPWLLLDQSEVARHGRGGAAA